MIKIKTDSNYLAKIFKIKNIRKHGNADRLQCVSVDFNNVITGLDAKDGDLYVFFPVGSQIDPNFISFLDGFSDETRNKNRVKGYFGGRGVVKAANLRSEKSEGYIVPLGKLEEFYETSGLDKYVNQYFDTVGDSIVCWKYEVREKNEEASSNKKTRKLNKKVSRLVEHQFRLHEDTDQLGRNIHKFNLDDEISITSKYHGCLQGETEIKTNKGDIKIKDIVDNKMSIKALSYNLETGENEYKKINGWFNNGESKDWYILKMDDGRSVIATSNHRFWMPELQCYRSVADLLAGDSALSI